MGDGYAANGGAGGQIVHRHVVNQQGIVARCGLWGLDGDAAVRAAVASHQHRILVISGGAVGVERLHWNEGAGIGGVGHHTYHHVGVI